MKKKLNSKNSCKFLISSYSVNQLIYITHIMDVNAAQYIHVLRLNTMEVNYNALCYSSYPKFE